VTVVVPGIEFVPLPAEFARTFVFSAALATGTKEVAAAKALFFCIWTGGHDGYSRRRYGSGRRERGCSHMRVKWLICVQTIADIHDGPEHMLQSETENIDARPHQPASTKALAAHGRTMHLGQALHFDPAPLTSWEAAMLATALRHERSFHNHAL